MPTSKQQTQLEYARLRMEESHISPDPNLASDTIPNPSAASSDPLDDAITAEQAQAFKTQGNTLYNDRQYDAAIERYTQAARSAHAQPHDRAIYLANRAAAYLKQQKFALVLKDTKQALTFKPGYVKALARQKEAHEALNDWPAALEDAKLLNSSPTHIAILQQRAQEKMKHDQTQAMDSLKGLGNSILSNFGMSLDDLAMEKDPDTGSYNIKMKQ